MFSGAWWIGPNHSSQGEIGSVMVCIRWLVCVCSRLWGDRSARARRESTRL